MNKIIDYIINMMPYMLISLPIIILIRIIIYKTNKRREMNWTHEITFLLFFLFMIGLSSQTFMPKFEIGTDGSLSVIKNTFSEMNLVPFKVFFDTYNEVFINGYINYFIINFLGNIIMFMPIGFFIPLLWKISNKKVILIGLSYSLLVEFSQLFLARGTDIDDLWLNTLGTFLGLLLYKLFSKMFCKFTSKVKLSN